ncbi:MAG: trypsin-like peptidase domain-containing protein [Clostridiales bacterium]|nr:trypsin-like peptidase domain-containing protein [Clostridiales bacterium]
MADYENRGDNINEEKDNRLDEENKQRETNPPENTNTDGIAGEHTQDTESGNDNRSENRYAEFREVRTEYEPPKKKKKKSEVHMTKGAVAMLIVLCLMVSVLAGVGMNALTGGSQDPSAVSTTGGTVQSGDGTTNSGVIPGQNTSNGNSETAPSVETQPRENTEYSALAKVANECIKSVVIINITETSTAYGQEYTTSGAGSGVIYTTDGYIITNYHVVGKDTKTISVTLYNGEVYEGKYIYGDEYADISVIKIEKNDCTPAKIGDSTKMVLGDTVLAIGNPLGCGLSVTDGIVSALARDVTVENTTMTLMQTSAAINSGNSGGGLFNTDGELIGIVNAKIGGTSVEGMGFAIPSSTVVKCLNDLKNYGYITGQARLGVTVQTKQYQTWPYMQTYSYIQVTEINANGSAAKSGLKVGDILQKINGTEISSFATLSQMLTKYEVGDTVTLTIRRPTIELTSSNLSEYLNTCEEIDITITFVEFNPNA